MDTEIATMVTAFIGFSAAGLISWRKLMVRARQAASPATETSGATASEV